MKIKTAINEFNLSLVGEIKAASRRLYISHVVHLYTDFPPDTEIEIITAADLRRWRLALVESGSYKIRTINHITASVKRLFKFLVSDGFLSADPASALRLIQDEEESGDPRAISIDDILRLLNHLNANGLVRDIAIVLFLFGTGCRVSGLCGLTMPDLDLAHNQAWVIEKGKGKGKGRWVFLDPPVLVALDNYLLNIRPPNSEPAVFVGRTGKGLERKSVSAMLVRHGRAAGVIGHCNAHAFRHAFAVNHLMNGQSLSAVSHLLGHADISITHHFYAKFEQRQLQQLHRQHSPVNGLLLPTGTNIYK